MAQNGPQPRGGGIASSMMTLFFLMVGMSLYLAYCDGTADKAIANLSEIDGEVNSPNGAYEIPDTWPMNPNGTPALSCQAGSDEQVAAGLADFPADQVPPPQCTTVISPTGGTFPASAWEAGTEDDEGGGGVGSWFDWLTRENVFRAVAILLAVVCIWKGVGSLRHRGNGGRPGRPTPAQVQAEAARQAAPRKPRNGPPTPWVEGNPDGTHGTTPPAEPGEWDDEDDDDPDGPSRA